MDTLTTALISAAGAGIFSTIGTVVALRVHITYLREGLNRVDKMAQRAHDRIDRVEHKI